jgi:hypothetical protein
MLELQNEVELAHLEKPAQIWDQKQGFVLKLHSQCFPFELVVRLGLL